MFEKIKRIFGFGNTRNPTPTFTPIFYDIKKHLETNEKEYKPNFDKLNDIIEKIDAEKKTIFIIDDNCWIVDMLEQEFNKKLINEKYKEQFNIIPICESDVGFDTIALLIQGVKIDYLLTDIEFGKIEQINGKRRKVDGIDVAIAANITNPDVEFMLFTGNVVTKETMVNYEYSSRFKDYFRKNILEYIMIKDTAFNFGYENQNIFTKICKGIK